MSEFKPHHTIQKKLDAAELTVALHGETLTVLRDGVRLARGPVSNVKALVNEAIGAMEAENFDLEAMRSSQEGEDGEGEAGGSVIARKYRDKYKAIGANDSNGDPLALALRAHLTKMTPGAKEGSKPTPSVDEAAMALVAEQNGIKVPTNGKNPGHTRMLLGNILRGMWRQGATIHVFGDKIEPTEEGKARLAARMAADEKRNAPKAPKQTPEERKAKDKARREAAKAAAPPKEPKPVKEKVAKEKPEKKASEKKGKAEKAAEAQAAA